MTSRRKWLDCSVLAVIGIPLLVLGAVMLVLLNSLGDPSDSDRGRSALVTSNPTVLPGSTLVERIVVITGFELNAGSCQAGSSCVKRYTLTLINLHAAPAYVAIKVNGLMETGSGGPPVPNSSIAITIDP